MSKLDFTLMSLTARAHLDKAGLSPAIAREPLLAYVDALCHAISGAFVRWQAQAILSDVQINGPRASGGRVKGPDLEGLIRAGLPGDWIDYSQPISTGIRDQMHRFEAELRVPNLVWYPSFANVAAANAPVTLNLPCKLAALAATARQHLSGAAIEARMAAHFENVAPASRELLAALGKAFDAAIPLWLDTMMVTQVQGSGPVPGFAPPDAPAGPVVGGTGAMQRGGGFF